MIPIVAQSYARARMADQHRDADARRRLIRARPPMTAHPAAPIVLDPTGLVRRLLARLTPSVAP